MKTTICILGLWFALIAFVQAETISFNGSFSSPDTRVNIVELYTSEGCSSCPPADSWLSKFKDDKRLWTEFIPVAFHVDYWNYIGWPDRFALPQNSQRQRSYANENNVSTVYTPGVMLNGKEWRAWYYKRPLVLDNSTKAGRLNVDIKDDQLSATFTSDQKNKTAFLNIAILGFDLMTTVQAGENNGRKLEHDFVVLGYERMSMKDSAEGYTLTTKLPMVIEPAPKTGLAAWIDYGKDLTPVQATGGWLASN